MSISSVQVLKILTSLPSSAQIARCHYSMYILNEYQPFVTDCTRQLRATQAELERGIINVTSKVTNLVALGLVGHLPISALVLPHSFFDSLPPQASL